MNIPGKTAQLGDHIQGLHHVSSDYDKLLDSIDDAELVFIGEATHGTHEFYKMRAEITQRLIQEKDFSAIAIEGDWPDTYRINRFVQGDKSIQTSLDALEGFKRFPTWMWRNHVILEWIGWLHELNSQRPLEKKVGFYGLDLYSLNASIEAVIQYLDKVDKEAAQRARQRYACFDPFKEEPQAYGYSTTFGLAPSCADAVLQQLIDLQRNALQYLEKNSLAEDEFFYIEQNARLVKNAEQYYRTMLYGQISSWNMRDTHMNETLGHLLVHLGKQQPTPVKMVIWAHNSHIGDARATQDGRKNQLNIGQLAKEKYGKKAFLIGFLTHSGTVTAASQWDGVAERKQMRPALKESYEHFFHQFRASHYLLIFKDNPSLQDIIQKNKLERAIGVIYAPQTERMSHYFHADITQQFDALIYLDKTTALKPLEAMAIWHKGEVFETFPSGL